MILWFITKTEAALCSSWGPLCYYLGRCHPQFALAAFAKVSVGVQFSVARGAFHPSCWHTAALRLHGVASRTVKGHKGWDVSVLKLQLTAQIHEGSMPEVWRPLSWGDAVPHCCSADIRSFSHCSQAAATLCLFTGNCAKVLVVFWTFFAKLKWFA